jgi:hypothetical protein
MCLCKKKRTVAAAALPFAMLLLLPAPVPLVAQGVASAGRTAQAKRPLPPGMTAPEVDFRDIARAAGLAGVNVSGDPQNKSYIVESTGTGVAVFDYDRDGLQDILLVNADLLVPKEPHPKHYLYRNRGNLRFEDVTEKAGIAHTGWAQGACVGDFDNDGYEDVLITQWGPNVLLRNNGAGAFIDETQRRGLAVQNTRWSTGCAFLDYDRDGDLDLFVANYSRFDVKTTPKPGEKAECRWKGLAVLCGPLGLPGESMSLYQNDGKGAFRDVSAKAGIETEKSYYGFTPLTADFDNDGWVDIYVTCDSTPSLLFHNQRDGTFKEVGLVSGAAYNGDGQVQAGMGATAADADGDGYLDIFKTNFSDDTHTFYRNEGDMFFTDETARAGLAVNTKLVGWGAAFVDFDQDGRKDLFVANGHVYPSIDSGNGGETFRQRRLLYWNRGDGQFHDMSESSGAGILARHSSRGIAVADFDNDGDMEIVVVNMHEPPSLLVNYGPKANSVLIEALTGSGRAALGARITVSAAGVKQVDEVRSGGYQVSQSDFRVHFGVGSATKLDVDIRWPGGSVDSFRGLNANRWITIREGKGIEASRAFRD